MDSEKSPFGGGRNPMGRLEWPFKCRVPHHLESSSQSCVAFVPRVQDMDIPSICLLHIQPSLLWVIPPADLYVLHHVLWVSVLSHDKIFISGDLCFHVDVFAFYSKATNDSSKLFVSGPPHNRGPTSALVFMARLVPLWLWPTSAPQIFCAVGTPVTKFPEAFEALYLFSDVANPAEFHLLSCPWICSYLGLLIP